MTKPTPQGDNPIERLLQDRAQFVNWLTRLNSTGEDAAAVPEAVRGRVRADYERRLQAVVEELRVHSATLEGQVQDHATRGEALAGAEQGLREQYAESEIRHLVGEYDDTKWEGIRSELLRKIAHVREELDQAHAEVARLNEVLGSIRAPALPEEPSPPPPPAHPAPEPPAAKAPAVVESEEPFVTRGVPESPPPAPAPRGPAKAGPKKEEGPGRTLWFPTGKSAEAAAPAPQRAEKLDELAFLKSVTDTDQLGATTPKARPSGGFQKVSPEPPAAPEPPPAKAAAPAVAPEAAKDRPSQSSTQKTLKCGECGTLNRPTEWYCERCGAELATL